MNLVTLEFGDAEIFKNLMRLIKQTENPETIFRADKEGIRYREMDKAHVMLIDFFLNGFNLKNYKCEKDFSYKVKTDDLVKVERKIGKNDKVKIKVTEELMTIEAKSGDSIKKTFAIYLLDHKYVDGVREGIPDMIKLPDIPQMDSSVTVDSISLIKALHAVEIFEDHVTFRTYAKGAYVLSLSSQINFKDTVELEYGKTEIKMKAPAVKMASRKNDHSSYSIDYMLPYLKIFPDRDIFFQFHFKYPIRFISHSIIPNIQFYLAPRITPEEEKEDAN